MAKARKIAPAGEAFASSREAPLSPAEASPARLSLKTVLLIASRQTRRGLRAPAKGPLIPLERTQHGCQ